MSSEEFKDEDTIEEKRRKNVIDNQKFLESLKLFNVRDDFKSTVHSATNKPKRKVPIDPSELRRSSRIKSLPPTNPTTDDEDFLLSSASVSSSEEEDDLSSAFTTKIDNDWQPSHPKKVSSAATTLKPRPVRKALKIGPGGVKIFYPNIGLEAAKVVSNDRSHKTHVSKKINVAISSSDEEN